jgi:hypothetical protein
MQNCGDDLKCMGKIHLEYSNLDYSRNKEFLSSAADCLFGNCTEFDKINYTFRETETNSGNVQYNVEDLFLLQPKESVFHTYETDPISGKPVNVIFGSQDGYQKYVNPTIGYEYVFDANKGNHLVTSPLNVGTYNFYNKSLDSYNGFKFSYKIVEGEYTVGGLQEGHYGVIQKEVQKAIVRGFNTIPCRYVIWSALRAKAQDKESREFVLGPEVVGSAMTHKVPSLLGSTFYLESATGKAKDSEETFRYVKAHFESGIDAELNLPFVAKCRVLEDAYPALKAVFKKGYVPCVAGKSGLERYFEVEEEILKEYSLD